METNENKTNRFKTLPSFVLDCLYSEEILDVITDIRRRYLAGDLVLNGILKDIIALVVLKDIKIEQLRLAVEEGLKLDKEKSKEITLLILCKILYPIKNFFPGIDDEILKLGGEIPKIEMKFTGEQLAKRGEEMEALREEEEKAEEKESEDVIVELPINDLIEKYPAVESQQIGSQESISVVGMDVPMRPEIKYWIKDYIEKTGYNISHSNLERVSYIYHDKNTKDMNEEERRQLGLVLKSFDDGIYLPYSTRMKKIDFSKIVEE